MITDVEDHGSKLGAVSFSLFVLPKNEPARILYEKRGYQEDGLGRTGGIKYSKINLD
jgi:ribosomal protein S18 acetylase RimI-like enzyme